MFCGCLYRWVCLVGCLKFCVSTEPTGGARGGPMGEADPTRIKCVYTIKDSA